MWFWTDGVANDDVFLLYLTPAVWCLIVMLHSYTYSVHKRKKGSSKGQVYSGQSDSAFEIRTSNSCVGVICK